MFCEACAAGTYSNSDGATSAHACISCPPNTVSAAGSSSVENCTCMKGYQRTGGQCQLCPVGKFKTTAGEGLCEQCPAGYTSALGSTDNRSCICQAGYSGATCSACSPGTFKDNTGTDPCVKCPVGTFSGITAATDLMSCESCPQHRSSLAGSNSRINCTCNAGFFTLDTGACAVCPPNSYSEYPGSTSCLQCEGSLSSGAASSSAAACRVISPSIRGVKSRMHLINMTSIQDFLHVKAFFVSSLANAANQDQSLNVVSEDYVTVSQVCDNTRCFEIAETNRTIYFQK